MKAALALSALLLSLITPHAYAGPITYDWQGDCIAGCIGKAHASLFLSDYTPGTIFQAFDTPALALVFDYADSNGTRHFPSGNSFGSTGILPAVPDYAALLYWFNEPDNALREVIDGSWSVRFEPGLNTPGIIAFGSEGIWTPRRVVPEPGSLALLLLAALALLAARTSGLNFRRLLPAR